MKRIHIVGRKNHGKTTLILELIRELTRRGLRVGTIKHSPHEHEVEASGTDSHRHRMAGASPAAFLSADMAAVFLPRQSNGNPYADLEPMYEDCDFVVVEGDLETSAPKIEVWRASGGTRPLALERTDIGIIAVITNDALRVDVPVWPRSDVSGLADRIASTAMGGGGDDAKGSDSVPAYILAGGQSSRFGSDKARAVVHDKPLILHVAESIRPVSSSITAVADRRNKYADLGLRTIADSVANMGPLGGLLTALQDAQDDWLLLVSCDWLGLRTAWMELLVNLPRTDVSVVAFRDRRWQPFPALFRKDVLDRVREQLNHRDRSFSLQNLMDAVRTRGLPCPSDWHKAVQINTPSCLAGIDDEVDGR